MATKTTNYSFGKPDEEEFYDIQNYNDFLDSLDEILIGKLDAQEGKGLSSNDFTDSEKNKLSNIESNANRYIHPTTHPASMIEESTFRRFVSDTEKTAWNNKLDSTDNAATATKLKNSRTIDGVSFDGSANCYHYGTCSTAGATKAKTCSITGFSLVTGAKITVYFTYGITINDATLNVNSTGAKQIYYKGKALKADAISSNTAVTLVYSGSFWRVVGELFSSGSAADFFGNYDLNTYKVPGRYVCHVDREEWENAPSDWVTSWLEIYENGGAITQVLKEYNGGHIYIRGYYESWSAWKTFECVSE